MPACSFTGPEPTVEMESHSPYSGTLAAAFTEDMSAYSYDINAQTGDVRGHDLLLDDVRVYTSLEPPGYHNANDILNSSSSPLNNANTNSWSHHIDSTEDDFDCWSSLNPDQHNLRRWIFTHPKSWTTDQVLDWIYYVANQQQTSIQGTIQGEKFNHMLGPQLCALTQIEFCQLEPTYGAVLYDTLQGLLKQGSFTPPNIEEPCVTSPGYQTPNQVLPAIGSVLQPGFNMDSYSNTNTNININWRHHSLTSGIMDSDVRAGFAPTPKHTNWWARQSRLFSGLAGEDPSLAPQYRQQMVPSTGGNPLTGFDFDETDRFSDIMNFDESTSGYDSEDCSSSSSSVSLHDQFERQMALPNLPSFDSHLSSEAHLTHCPSPPPPQQPKKRGRPKKIVTAVDGVAPHTSNRGRKHGQITKGNHLWEFVRDLLKDPQCNPLLLKWEDKSEGVFRFVKSERVAELWGKKKNNSQMTYEKLSRAMRFCRTTSYFSSVPKTGKYPKKLCFKFGEKATGWQ